MPSWPCLPRHNSPSQWAPQFTALPQVSIRQAATPLRLQGRMNGVMSALQGGLVPVGALMGGVLGQTIGLRPTLFLSAGGELAAVLWLLVTPIWSLHDLPEAEDA